MPYAIHNPDRPDRPNRPVQGLAIDKDLFQTILLYNIIYGRIAQLGERRPYKPEVTGSSPVAPTMIVWGRGAVG